MHTILTRLASWHRFLRQWCKGHATRHALHNLSDWQLRDIGLTRGQIDDLGTPDPVAADDHKAPRGAFAAIGGPA